MDQRRLIELQKRLAQHVHIPARGQGYQPEQGNLVFGLDVQYAGDQAYVGVDVREWPGQQIGNSHSRYEIECGRSGGFGRVLNDRTHRLKPLCRQDEHSRAGSFAGLVDVQVPYVPRFFCFREGPPLLTTLMAIRERFDLDPDLILVDGHGIAHPRRFGLACWVGVKTGTPTIGCAKNTLLKYTGEVGRERGDVLPIRDGSQVVGAALTTRSEVKPVFVSPGHEISLETALEVILALSRYRIPDPLRRADQVARACARGQVLDRVTVLAKLA